MDKSITDNDVELVRAKHLADFLKEQFIFFATVKKCAVTQDQIIDRLEKIVEPYVSKIKVVNNSILK